MTVHNTKIQAADDASNWPAGTRIVAISELRPYEGNARTHSRKQVKKIAASIERFGFLNPVLADENNRIIAGHGRVSAAHIKDCSVLNALI